MSKSTKLELFQAAAEAANKITTTSVEKVATVQGRCYQVTNSNGFNGVIHGAFASAVTLANLHPIRQPKAKGSRPTSGVSVLATPADAIEIEVEGMMFRVKQIRMEVSLVLMGQASPVLTDEQLAVINAPKSKVEPLPTTESEPVQATPATTRTRKSDSKPSANPINGSTAKPLVPPVTV